MSSQSTSSTEVPTEVVTQMVTPIDQMMKHRCHAWQDTMNGVTNYKYKFGDTVRGKHLAEEKMAKVNQIFGDVIQV